MGNQLASQTAQLDYYLHDLPGIVYETSLGKGRFLKTLQCIHDEGTVVVKVYIKRDPSQSLKEQVEKLTEIREYFSFIENPNVLPFRRWIETDKAGYLIRQYFVNNLYDRISTRPFLTIIEKRWIVFQLLTALNQCHFYGICHGDIKCENILVTSWNWIYLSDFASYKPTYIPEDNPADFSFFFDSGGRRTGYMAPERFYAGVPPEGDLTQEMDIFAVGCVIAELFLEGTPIFNFAQLLGYRKGMYDPEAVISRIPDPAIQELVKHMIQKDPKKRYSAKKYLTMWASTAFPSYFPYLHSYISKLMKMEPDEKVNTVKVDFESLLDRFSGKDLPVDPASQPKDDQLSTSVEYTPPPKRSSSKQIGMEGSAELENQDPSYMLLMETEKFVHRLETESNNNTAPISSSPEDKVKPPTRVPPTMAVINEETFISPPSSSSPSFTTAPLPSLHKSSSSNSLTTSTSSTIPQTGTEGLVIVLDILCSFIPTLKFPSTKLYALELLSLFAKYLDSEVRLQRIVPYVVFLLSEDSALVRATAIRTLAKVLEKVETFPPSDSHVFPAYILPALSKFSSEEPEDLVREAYAENLALLAETAKRFLETSQFFKQSSEVNPSDRDMLSYQESYDAELAEIQEAFYEIVVEMLTKGFSTAVRRTLLLDITRLCIFLGRQKTNDFLLPLIITFLNDRHDWELRCAFFQNIVGVSAFVGMDSLELFILPCILQALTDDEEFVIDKAVNSLASLCELGLFRKHVLFDIAEKSARMLYHPNMWIRYGVVALMAAIATQLKLADVHCFLIPVLKPFLVTEIIDITESNLLEALKPPVPRPSFDKVMASVFEMLTSMENNPDSDLQRRRPGAVDKSDELSPFEVMFKQILGSSGIAKEDEDKLWVMRKFIASSAQAKKGKFSKQDDDPSMYDASRFVVHSLALPNPSPAPSTVNSASENRKTMKPRPSQNILTPNVSSTDLRKSTKGTELGTSTLSPSSGVRTLRRNSVDASTPRPRPVYVAADGTSVKDLLPGGFPARLFPPSPPDLGALLTDAPLTGESLKDWQPKGILVAHLYEHKGPVNQIQVSQDNMFFVSGSDDGTVKIWDCMRLEKNVTNRSRSTYSSQGGKIKALTILENSHSIAAGSDNGSIHVFRVEYTKKENTLHRYTGVTTVKNIDVTEGSIVGLDHFNTDSQSLLVYATNKGKIHSWDLRAKNEAWTMTNPSNLGLLTSFVIEPGHNWLVTGTSSGYFTCWDMRFLIPVKTWRHFAKSRIYRLAHYSALLNSSWVYASSGNSNDITAWDVEKGICTQIFRIVSPSESTSVPNVRGTDEQSLSNYGVEELQNPTIPTGSTAGIKAFINPPDCNYLITAGDDRKIRYWDLANAVNSYTVCGLTPDQSKPRYSSHIHEQATQSLATSQSTAQATSSKFTVYQEVSTASITSLDAESQNLLSPSKAIPAAPSVNHHESILDLKMLELPHRMLVSAGRDGVVKVWK